MFPADTIRKELNRKGFECSKSNFYSLLRNPVYSGKIRVPRYGNEAEHLVVGQHIPIVSESLFDDVQYHLNRKDSSKIASTDDLRLVLRQFIICPKCSKLLTGSRSKGRASYYYYYHCQLTCRERYKADHVNELFRKELRKYESKPEYLQLFKIILKRKYELKMQADINERLSVGDQLAAEIIRFNNARTLLLDKDLDINEYNEIKLLYQAKTAELQLRLDNIPDHVNMFWESIKRQERALMNLPYFFEQANFFQKRVLINLIFPERLQIKDNVLDIGANGMAIDLIFSKQNLK